MAITTLDGLIGAPKQKISWMKTATRTTVAAGWFSLFDLAGDPGAGTLAAGSTAAGVVPTDATPGCPVISAFGGGATGYLGNLSFGSNVACRIRLFDLLFKAGAYAFNANTALAAQPSYAARLPGTDYKQTELWVEAVTAATGNLAVNVTYTDQDGNGGATTGAVGIGAAPTVGRCWQLPYASGDSGAQLITNVAGSVASAGTFNVLVLRPLAEMRVRSINDGDVFDALRLGLPQIFADSALFALVSPDSTSSGLPDLEMTIYNG
jgi:hypothetical protein